MAYFDLLLFRYLLDTDLYYRFMIPKIIHYCWFGGKPKPQKVLEYIETWKKFLPDFEIKEWNESNFDISQCQFVKEAYESKKYAFVADYTRLYVLYKYGGIYFDTDVEVLKSFVNFENFDMFMGLEMDGQVGTSVIGAKPSHKLIKEFLDYYKSKAFINKDGSLDRTPNTVIISQILKEHNIGLENRCVVIDNIGIFSKDYFSPVNIFTGKLKITDNTHSIHHFSGSWQTPKEKFIVFIKTFIRRIIKKY